MTLTRPNLIRLFVPLLVFAATFLAVRLIDGSSGSNSAGADAGAGGFADARSTDQRIRTLQAAARGNTAKAAPYAALGEAYLQKARETADPAYYVRAEGSLRIALERDPRDPAALVGMGALANARHDFPAALRYGERARAAAPDILRSYAVIVDAQIELGRYEAAERTLQRMVDLKPNLASYARVSYFRELHGDLAGASEAMRLAVAAGGDAAENTAYVQTLVGTLELDRGRIAAGERAYRLALSRYPAYVPAQAGLARAAGSRGELPLAIVRYRNVVKRLPLPEHVIALGEAELAAGRRAAARENFALVRVQQRLFRRSGVNLDLEIALFEANHGDPRRALRIARRLWSQAPSVRSADAVGWALTRNGRADEGLSWSRRALRLGSKDPLFLYHAGLAARAAGRRDLARSYLRRSLALNPRFSPLYAPRAQRALEALR